MAQSRLLEAELTREVIGAFYEVYNTLGFGFLEHLYVLALERELLLRGHQVERERSIRVKYKSYDLGLQRLDMVVDDKLIVEVKSVYQLPEAVTRQLYNYLKASRIQVGLLLHFGPEPAFHRLIFTARTDFR